MADLMDYHRDVQEAMGRNYAVPDDIDEEELLGELDSLESELAMEKETARPDAVPSYLLEPDLPAAPTGAPASAQPASAQLAQAAATDEFGLPLVPARTA